MKYLLIAFLLCSSPGFAATINPKTLDSYDFDASLPLPRQRPIPPWLLEGWSAADGASYEAYTPTREEAKLLASAFAGLPAPMKKTLSERLIAVYLVKGLKGNGITDWVLDASSRPYVYMIYNAAGFRQTLSELLTERDQTLFRGKADLRVEAGKGKGILYTVAHESAHAVDYVRHVTPYTEPGFPKYLDPAFKGGISWDVWDDYARPKPEADYPLRTKLHFYGFGAPELDPSQAGELYSQWAAGPFASFYGSRAWAEDLAELFVLRHLTQDLGMPLKRRFGKRTISPWDNPKVRARAEKLLVPFYR